MNFYLSIIYGATGGSPVTPGVYFAVGVTAKVDDRVGRGVGELSGNGVGGGLGVLVGGGNGVLVGGGNWVFVGSWVGIAVGAGWVGKGVFVTIFSCVAVGIGVFVGFGEKLVEVAVSVADDIGKFVGVEVCCGEEVCVERGSSVAVGSSGISLVSVPLGGILPEKTIVGVGVSVAGTITAISGTPPVSGGLSIPNKSLIMSSPIAGTERTISSTL